MYKAFDKWLWPYLKSSLRRPRGAAGPVHIMVAVCDHYEPLSPNAEKSISVGDARVNRWLDEWPKLAEQFVDADGRHPCHSIFYPAEAAEKPDRYIPMLKPLFDAGWAEVEIHLHHEDDTAESLTAQLTEFRDYLHKEQGMLGVNAEGRPGYAFIHGNWALCNSHPEGRHCGVNEEIQVLLETGCYVDYTFPSIPSPTQPKHFCNSIYYARDLGGPPRSYDYGNRARVGYEAAADELMLLQGPAALNWKWRKKGIFPRIEHADLCGTNPPTPLRADLWVDQHIHVEGRPEWVFIKLHTHGCIEANAEVLLGAPMRATLNHLQSTYNDGKKHQLHYVSAREMYNIALAAVEGKSGNPNDFRDYQWSLKR